MSEKRWSFGINRLIYENHSFFHLLILWSLNSSFFVLFLFANIPMFQLPAAAILAHRVLKRRSLSASPSPTRVVRICSNSWTRTAIWLCNRTTCWPPIGRSKWRFLRRNIDSRGLRGINRLKEKDNDFLEEYYFFTKSISLAKNRQIKQ